MQTDLLLRLAVALAIGMVVGLERGWRLRDEPAGSRVAGIRTFGLAGLLGGAAAAMAQESSSPIIFAAALLSFAAVFALFEERSARRRNTYSVTATIAGLAVFTLGALAVVGDLIAAGAGGVAVACILASREVAHNLLRRLTWPEVRSALLLLAMTVIVLPVLPNRAIDPWGGFNPFEIWLFTVLVATISFAGYIAVRVIGASRGLLVASLLGALVSSTAVTMALGRRARVEGASSTLVGGALLAAMVSVLRVVVLIAIAAPGLLPLVVGPALIGALTFGTAGLWFASRRAEAAAGDATVGNPFDAGPLVVFGVIFATVSIASAAAATSWGPGSLVATSGLSAILDVDAATLAVARLSLDGVPEDAAALAVLVALAANALGRVGVAVIVGPSRYWFPLGIAAAAAIGAGTVGMLLLGSELPREA